MKNNLRTAALLATGLAGAGSVIAEEAKMNPVETALSATTISGYVSSTALFDVKGVKGGTALPGRTFDQGINAAFANRIDQFSLDVVKLVVAKDLDESDWSAGYKADLVFGPDANVYGVNSVLGAGNTSDFGIKQAYVQLHAPVGNGLTAKMGVFDTIIGYEVFESVNNPNYSRSYAYFIEPFAHTGLLLSYQLTEGLSVNAGVANGWSPRINSPGAEVAGVGGVKDFGIQTYLGSIAYTAGDSAGALKGTSLYAGVVHGLTTAQDTTDGDPRTSLYAGLTLPLPIEGLAIGAAWDYRFSERARAGVDNADEYATTVAGYLSYQLTKQLKLSARGEYATGSAGTWGARAAGGTSNEEFLGLTGTLDIALWANVLTRIEVRWDQDLTDAGGAFGNAGNPHDEALIAGLNLIYKF